MTGYKLTSTKSVCDSPHPLVRPVTWSTGGSQTDFETDFSFFTPPRRYALARGCEKCHLGLAPSISRPRRARPVSGDAIVILCYEKNLNIFIFIIFISEEFKNTRAPKSIEVFEVSLRCVEVGMKKV